MSKFPINLIGELIAVTFEPVQGTVRLPDWKRSLKGTVIARGSDVRDVSEGQVVSFGAAVGMDSVFAGKEVRILKEQDLDFVYSDVPLCEECGTNYVESSEDFCTDCLDKDPSLSYHY